jgi:hypothetical protein
VTRDVRRAEILRALRAIAAPAIVLLAYAASRWAFAAATVDDGLLTPEGAPATSVVVLGLLTLLLRLGALFGVPAWIAWRLVAWLAGRASYTSR